MAMPANQLASTLQPKPQRASTAQPRKGAAKLTRPMAPACFHCLRNTAGSSSAPARKVSSIAPAPARNLIHDASPASTALPSIAPMKSCAMVPTTISDNAVATRSQIDSMEASRASPSHTAAWVQISVMARTSKSGGFGWLVRVRIHHAEAGRDVGVEDPQFFPVQQIQQLARFRFADDELHFHREGPRQFEEVILMQVMVTAEAGHGPECRTAPDAETVGMFQQPFPGQPPVAALVFVQVEPEK